MPHESPSCLFEGLNVGGSIKTRTALNMIEDAEKKGLINKDTVIVEPTSGNQGIGLALIGAVKGYKTIIIMPDSVSEERRKLVQHYFFFFKQKTAYEMRMGDWSSDVCSSDLGDKQRHCAPAFRRSILRCQIGRASCRERV